MNVLKAVVLPGMFALLLSSHMVTQQTVSWSSRSRDGQSWDQPHLWTHVFFQRLTPGLPPHLGPIHCVWPPWGLTPAPSPVCFPPPLLAVCLPHTNQAKPKRNVCCAAALHVHMPVTITRGLTSSHWVKQLPTCRHFQALALRDGKGQPALRCSMGMASGRSGWVHQPQQTWV